MTQLLVRNKVQDFERWLGYFRADEAAAAGYGLTVLSLWQAADDPNDVYFLFEVESIEQANAFMARPESARTGELAGVIDGELRYIEPVR